MAVSWSSCCAATASTSAPLRPARVKSSAPWSAGTSRSTCRRERRRELSVRATAAAPPPPVDYADTSAGTGTGTAGADYVASLKIKLLSAVSGLNRGLAATQEDLDRADAAARALESAAGTPVDLTDSSVLDRLQGRWRLLYSSAFSSGTLGGSRPGPPTGRLLPITLGQVFQRIDVVSRDFDNVVELELGAPWPLPPLEATATLAHKFEVVGTSGIKITFEKTTVKTQGRAGAAAAAGGAAAPGQPPAAEQHRERRVQGHVPRRRHARHARGQGRAQGLRHRVKLNLPAGS